MSLTFPISVVDGSLLTCGRSHLLASRQGSLSSFTSEPSSPEKVCFTPGRSEWRIDIQVRHILLVNHKEITLKRFLPVHWVLLLTKGSSKSACSRGGCACFLLGRRHLSWTFHTAGSRASSVLFKVDQHFYLIIVSVENNCFTSIHSSKW